MLEGLRESIAIFKRLDAKKSEGELTAEEERQWLEAKEAIEVAAEERHTLPPSSRRKSLRVPAELEVEFQDAGGFQRAYLRNISEGGVYIATKLELKMGDRFALTIVVRDPEHTLNLPVEVVWVNKTPSPSSGLEPGVGVAWLALPPEDKAVIKSIVHRSLDQIARSQTDP